MTFSKVKKNFGFGCMRLPLLDEKIDEKAFSEMIDTFIAEGFNYFDTARIYHKGDSEKALKNCLTSRYEREDYVLADKLSDMNWEKEADIRPLFEDQLKTCGVEYFDFYLMHAMNKQKFEKYKRERAFEIALELKEEGKIKHLGFSFHDSPEVLEEILLTYPEMEFVQIQFNYLDYHNPVVQSKGCYDVCKKYNKPIIIMEPVKGGQLINLPDEAKEIFDEVGSGSYASYAIRYAASYDGVFMVLSGMSDMQQMQDNIHTMKLFEKVNEKEMTAIKKVSTILQNQNRIDCTACQYCVPNCPQEILIPDVFRAYNDLKIYNNWRAKGMYEDATTQNGKASYCIECGLCESMCPQFLPIRDLLKDVTETFEK